MRMKKRKKRKITEIREIEVDLREVVLQEVIRTAGLQKELTPARSVEAQTARTR